MKIIYITGNKFKLETAKKILEPLGFEIEGKKMELIEKQSDSIEEVAKYSSEVASKRLKVSTLKNDSGLVIPALNNFPSAYTKYVEETITEDGILKLMQDIEDRGAYFLEVLAYTEFGKGSKVFISKTEGTIAKEKDGDFGWSYDKIFIPKGETKTLACFDDDMRWKFWDDDAYIKLAEYLKS
jgi:XTP/dITP diphosphohydrolase